MSFAPSIGTLADRAAEKRSASADKSDAGFHQIIRDVLRGAGISPAQSARYFTAVQNELSRRSAVKRHAEAAHRRAAKQLMERIAP